MSVNSTRLQLPLYQLSKCGTIIPADEQSEAHKDKDWRGLVKLWEPPRPRSRYVMGIDPAGGIVNWDRVRRLNDDRKKDDSAIEIIKCGDGRTISDVQVAEFRAPISAEDIAPIAVLLGRLYAGNSESNEALCVIETYPGPGMLTHTAMIQKHGYTNMWRWEYLDKMLPTIANSYGWTSNVKTLDYLWNKFSRHVGKHLFTIRSRALLDQMGNLQHMPNKTFPLACGEVVHDDLVRAAAMGIWCVPPDTKVLMASGERIEIRDIKVGDQVISKTGVSSVEKVYIRAKSESIMRLKICGQVEDLRCTKDHKILVQKKKAVRSNRKSRAKTGSELEWIKASEAKIGQMMLVPAQRDLPKSRFSDDQLYLMGWYLAEGFITKTRIYLTLGPHEVDKAEELVVIAQKWMDDEPSNFWLKSKAKIKKTRTSTVVQFASPIISRIFMDHMGTGSYTKKLSPSLLWSSGLLPLVRGWVEGDGHFYPNGSKCVAATVSESLASNMRQVLMNHNIWSTIKVAKKGERLLEGRLLKPSTHFDITIGVNGCNRIFSLVDVPVDEDLRYQRMSPSRFGFLTPITKVSEERYEGPVYDLTTTDHTFTASGVIIHNCARDWIFTDEPIPEPQAINGGRQSLNPQSSDMTSEQYDDWAEDMFASMLDGN